MTTPTTHAARRDFMQTLAGGTLALAGGLPARLMAATAPPAASTDPWRHAQAIIDRVSKPLTFRKEDFVITAFGGKACEVVPINAWVGSSDRADIHTPAPGSTDCHPAISAACHKAGGGRVLISFPIASKEWFFCIPQSVHVIILSVALYGACCYIA